MIDIHGLGPVNPPIPPDDIEKERLKDIKTRVGKAAFTYLFGNKAKVTHVSQGIARSEGALKMINEVMSEEKWKDS